MTWRLSAVPVAGALTAGALLLFLLGSVGSPPPGGDPGNRALHLLAADPIFATMPGGANPQALELRPAAYRQPGFAGGGWSGPGVTRSFTSAARPATVYAFFGAQAERGEWTVIGYNVLGLAFSWRKVYSNGDSASLSLSGFDPRDLAAHPRSYQLSGSIQANPGGQPRSGRNSS